MPQKVIEALQIFVAQNTQPIWVGFSGGLDSTVLLHALVQLRTTHSSASNFQLHAVYIHHGLQSVADDWQAFCEALCREWQVSFAAVSVQVDALGRQGVEAVARQKRYEAFAHLIQNQGVLVTAHHQRDQAETLLMALARGAGVQGLGAMLPLTEKWINGQMLQQARPLLSVPYDALQSYAKHYQLSWVEDPTNQNTDFKRNFVRHEILPKFNQAWSFSEQNMASCAQHCQEAAELLQSLALIDVGDKSCSIYGFDLQILDGLSWARQKNVLQFWLKKYWRLTLTQSCLDWLKKTLAEYKVQSLPSYRLGSSHFLRMHNFKLYCLCLNDMAISAPTYDYAFSDVLLLKEEVVSLYPFHHLIPVEWLTQHQIHAAWFSSELRLRSLQVEDFKQVKGLKTWFKNQGIAPWLREIWPVVSCQNDLVTILGFKTLQKYQNPPVNGLR